MDLRPPLDRGALAFFGHFKRHRTWAGIIAAINLVGIAYGFYYYQTQFQQTPWWLWPFVPDSPLAVLWAELALIAYWLRRESSLLDALAFIGNLQVGIWTVYVLLAYEEGFHTLDFLQGEGPPDLNAVLLVGHAGMALLALIYLEGLRERARLRRAAVAGGIALATLYYLVQDGLDYWGHHLGLDFMENGCGIRPHVVPCDAAREPTLALITLALTLASAAVLAWVTLRPASNAGRK